MRPAAGRTAASWVGCYDAAGNAITILQGWSWYAGAEPESVRRPDRVGRRPRFWL